MLKRPDDKRAKWTRGIPGRLCAVFLSAALSLAGAGEAIASGEATPLSEAAAARAGGDFTGAVALLDGLLADDPDNSDALVELGFAHLALGNIGAARDAFRRTLAIAPDYVDATLGLAYASYRTGDIEETIRLATSVLEQAPDYKAAADLLASAKAAQKARSALAISPVPLARPVPGATLETVRPPVARPDRRGVRLAEPNRRFFFSVGQRLGRGNDLDVNLAVEIRKPNGVSLVYGVRHTDRSYGDATQAKVALFRKTGDLVLGAEIGIATGEDNLPRTSVGLSLSSKLSERVGYSARLTYEHFKDADVITFAPRVSITPRPRSEVSVGAVFSHSSAVRGTAAVVDVRALVDIADDMTLRFGAAYGEELDGDRMRDLRSLSFGLTRIVSDTLSLTATLSSEPGRRRVDFGVVRRF